jgi:uncharacterized protein (DUF1499 family)
VRYRRQAMLIFLIGLAVVGAGMLSLRVYLGRAAESRLRPDEVVDFAARGSAGRDNVFAMCPPGFCIPPADRESPVFAVGWERVRDLWKDVVAAQPRVEEVVDDPVRRRLVYIQRSPLLRFPDIVTIEFIPLDGERATLAIDSRARYGRSDFHVNRRRVLKWVRLLERLAQSETLKAD